MGDNKKKIYKIEEFMKKLNERVELEPAWEKVTE